MPAKRPVHSREITLSVEEHKHLCLFQYRQKQLQQRSCWFGVLLKENERVERVGVYASRKQRHGGFLALVIDLDGVMVGLCMYDSTRMMMVFISKRNVTRSSFDRFGINCYLYSKHVTVFTEKWSRGKGSAKLMPSRSDLSRAIHSRTPILSSRSDNGE